MIYKPFEIWGHIRKNHALRAFFVKKRNENFLNLKIRVNLT